MPTMRLALAAALSLAASAALAEPAESTYRLSLKDHRFTPDSIEVPADTKATLLLKNEDDTPEEFDSHDLKREKVVAAGKEITILVGPLKPGTYKFVGEHHKDTATGTLVVK